ncbi:MAG: type II toxin-antitoxin system VapC family toxin [Cyanobacteriota bacterium]|nr:type II toxin-antitoxin system VapC family toxin [Cyanobacteriota bacterium]
MQAVIDTSVAIAFFKKEPGWKIAADLFPRSCISQVNVIELATYLSGISMPQETIIKTIHKFSFQISTLTQEQVFLAGQLVRHTKPFGLSLGDRACLALARVQNLPAFTTDKIWAEVAKLIDVDVQLIR